MDVSDHLYIDVLGSVTQSRIEEYMHSTFLSHFDREPSSDEAARMISRLTVRRTCDPFMVLSILESWQSRPSLGLIVIDSLSALFLPYYTEPSSTVSTSTLPSKMKTK
jgi:hypothetical protein